MTRKELDKILESDYKDLSHAILSDVDLSHTNLRYANLSYADLSCANLRNADLRYANLFHADLSCANLRNADLRYANLFHADLSGADLLNADLSNADLLYAGLSNVILSPEDKCRLGEILKKKIIGYKKLNDNIIATLEIPKGAIVFGINKKQFRTNKAKCIALSDGNTIGYSTHDSEFSYEVGKRYTIKDFDLNYAVECSTGIHFFKTLKEAEAY